MNHGFVKVAAVTPKIKVADPEYNVKAIGELMQQASEKGACITVFPELCITGYTCSDLFWQKALIDEAESKLILLIKKSEFIRGIFFVGLPMEIQGKLYNVAAVFSDGELLGLVPKTYLPNYNEFYEVRHFCPGRSEEILTVEVGEWKVPFGTKLIFSCSTIKELKIAAEICEDLWVPQPPSITHAENGATVIVNLSASDETVGKPAYRRELVRSQSASLVCGYIYASAGEGESTTDLVFSGHNMIAENGTMLEESKSFTTGIILGDIDVERLIGERRRLSTYTMRNDGYQYIDFTIKQRPFTLMRYVDKAPFVPDNQAVRDERCEEILSIQALGLKKRLEHTGCVCSVIGISGGLDSTLAILVAAKACDMLNRSRTDITAVTMPCFGTTSRTYDNACKLVNSLGAKLVEVNIKEAVRTHFRDIGQDENIHDVTYENGQARERTQVLMDIANKSGGMVIGTGDMSELALGWATYNGDHMSMYGVNASVPKTLVRHLVGYFADHCQDTKLKEVLYDILDTPVSPELLPPEDGVISQKTEDLIGPYELHDFFLYYVLRFGFTPDKIYMLAQTAFQGKYDKQVILSWLNTFYSRFFAQQFKRSCLPDGPKVGSVALSPRGDLRMPSDASVALWKVRLLNLKENLESKLGDS